MHAHADSLIGGKADRYVLSTRPSPAFELLWIPIEVYRDQAKQFDGASDGMASAPRRNVMLNQRAKTLGDDGVGVTRTIADYRNS